MTANSGDEFYIGYLPRAPRGIARRMRWTIFLLLGCAAVVATLLVLHQRPFYPSIFEFGVYRNFEGIIKTQPYPLLLVKRPGAVAELPEYSPYYLVAFGKFGAQQLVEDLDGRRVKLQGSLIYRDNQTMIEVVEGSIEVVNDEPQPLGDFTVAENGSDYLGFFELRGEIVDSKCFFGVMNPGNLKSHKSCAVRCLSGGVPPVFVVRNRDGLATYFLLVGEDGRMVNKAVLPLVAIPLRIQGKVFQHGDLLVLKANPETYQRM